MAEYMLKCDITTARITLILFQYIITKHQLLKLSIIHAVEKTDLLSF